MSCLNLKGLFPTTKVLKLFSTKVLFKLHRLNASKVIKKRNNNHKASKKGAPPGWPKLTKKKRNKKFQFKLAKRLDFYKKPAPVYIDQLFVGPVASRPAILDRRSQVQDTVKFPTSLKKAESDHDRDHDHDQEASMAASSSSTGNEDLNDGAREADDMWEAVVLASPEMHGINERAEEFISRFWADMKRQETLAKQHL